MNVECFLNRYSTNSDFAYGSNKNEALVHSILENIERHYLSKFYECVIFDCNSNFKIIGNFNYVKKLIPELKNINCDNFDIIDISKIQNYMYESGKDMLWILIKKLSKSRQIYYREFYFLKIKVQFVILI